MTQQLYAQWFHIADADKDGAVGGAEAVSFFTRSGLPQAVLGQIWELASGGGAKLNQIQFSAAMRLVALAQARGGQLPLDQARAVIAGMGPDLQPPTLQGLEAAGAAAPGAVLPAAAGPRPAGAAPIPGVPTYGGAPAAAVPQYGVQLTGGAAAPGAGVPPPYAAGVARPAVGAPGAVGPTAGPGPAPAVVTAPSGYPPLPASELQRYQAAFQQLDADMDGFVTGGECFGFFTQSGLDKAVLRDIWSLVAGENSRLSGHQFVAFLYVLDLVKRGMPLPKYLPPGLAGFPPVAPGPGLQKLAAAAAPVAAAAPPPPPAAAAPWSLQSQFGTSSNITAVLASPPVTSLPAPPPPPAMPAKLELSTGERLAPPMQHVSHVPAVSAALLAGVSAMDRTKLQEEQQVCESKEKALQTVEERAAEARARQAQLTTALQELVVFRNRTEVALLTSQDQARRLEEEVEATRKRYDAGYAAAQTASEKSAAVHAHIMELMGQKAEMEEKMRRLESEVAAAERMGPADVARLEGELAELHSKCAALEVARNAKLAQVDGLRRQQDAARAQLADLQDAYRDAAAEVEACLASLESMEGELKEARASGVVATLPSLLSRAAIVYRGLYGLAHRTGTAVPFEALPATLEGLHVWADEVAAGVVDWADDDVDVRGYVMVNALPGADAARPILKPAAAPPGGAAAAPPPNMLPDDFADPATLAFGGGAGFDDPPAFGDAPAFGAPAGMSVPSAAARALPPAAAAPAAAAPPPPPAAMPSAPVDFGFDDAPAFGALPPAFLNPPAPTAAMAAAPLPESTSFAIDSQAAKTLGAVERSAASDDSAKPSRFGSGFSFGKEAGSSVETQQAVAVSAAPEPHAPETTAAATALAAAAFEDNAFGLPAFAAAAAAAVTAGPTGGSIAAAPADAEKPSLFGDDAFGAPSAFGSGFAAPAPAIATAVAAAAPAHSPSSSSGGAPSGGLPPTDSGPLESNPFAGGATLPALAAFAADAASAHTSPAPVAAAGGASGAFGEDAFGGEPSGIPAAAPPLAPSSSVPAAAPAPSTPAAGFGDDDPFGDADNPFGTPAFR